MTRPGIAALLFAALAALGATAQAGGPPQNQLRAAVARDLPAYVPGVDVSQLSQHQLATIYSILYGGYRASEKQSLLRSAIGGRNTLRGLLFN